MKVHVDETRNKLRQLTTVRVYLRGKPESKERKLLALCAEAGVAPVYALPSGEPAL